MSDVFALDVAEFAQPLRNASMTSRTERAGLADNPIRGNFLRLLRIDGAKREKHSAKNRLTS